ncbi:MAG: carboxypeptidase-like regulatory domain-containing protein [Bacteroidota bacterium]
MKHFSFFALVFVLAPLMSAQQADVRGVVTDSTSGERLPFVNVIIQSTNRGAATNISGFYLIPGVLPGTYEFVASAVGYKKSRQTVSIKGDASITLNFRLSPTSVELDEVVVTESSKRELSEISTSIHVLDQRDLKMTPATVQTDVFRAIQILPGISSTSDVSSQFYVRGGAGDQNLILLDGMKMYNPYHAFGLFSMFDSDIVNTTEVYTGAFPPGYGGRLSSVVNLTTKDGNKTGITAKGNLNFLSTKFQIEGPALENGRWIVNGRKSLFSRSLKNFFQEDVPVSFFDVFVKGSIDQDSASSAKLSVQAFLSGDDLLSSDPNNPNYRWRNLAVGFSATALVQDRLFVYATLGGTSFEAERDPKRSSTTTPASTSIQEFSVRANATYYTDSKDLYFFGFDLSFPSLEYNLVNNLGVARQLKSTLAEVATWVRYQSTFGKLKTDIGFHIEVGSMLQRGTGLNGVQPRINVSYELPFSWRAKLSYGLFTQNIIAVNNEDDLISIFDAWIEVPHALDSERAHHYVAGVEGNLSQTLSTTFQGYYKSFESLVTYNRDKVDAIDPDYINGTGRAYGVEALIRYGAGPMDLYAAYTLSWAVLRQGSYAYVPRHDRRHNLKLLGRLQLLPDLHMTLRWDLSSGFPYTQTVGFYDRIGFSDFDRSPFQGETGSPYTRLGEKNAKRMPAYHRLDFNISYLFQVGGLRGSVGLNVINVYDMKNVLYFDRTTGQQVNMLPFFPSATLNLEY